VRARTPTNLHKKRASRVILGSFRVLKAGKTALLALPAELRVQVGRVTAQIVMQALMRTPLVWSTVLPALKAERRIAPEKRNVINAWLERWRPILATKNARNVVELPL